jgi:hypothetical protein
MTDSPFYLLYGRDPTLPAGLRMYANPNSLRNIEIKGEKNYQRTMSKTLKTAYQRILQTREEEQKQYTTFTASKAILYSAAVEIADTKFIEIHEK